jgi:hypothetical protein
MRNSMKLKKQFMAGILLKNSIAKTQQTLLGIPMLVLSAQVQILATVACKRARLSTCLQ